MGRLAGRGMPSWLFSSVPLGSVNLRGQYTSAGFGAIDAPLAAYTRLTLSDLSQYADESERLFPRRQSSLSPLLLAQ